MRRFLDRCLDVKPAQSILGCQRDGPTVMYVHHATCTILGNNDEADLNLLRDIRREVRQTGHEYRLVRFARYKPGLFLAILYCPFEPTAARHNHSTFAEHVPEVAAR
jgi:hypothetical protein